MKHSPKREDEVLRHNEAWKDQELSRCRSKEPHEQKPDLKGSHALQSDTFRLPQCCVMPAETVIHQ